MAVIQVKCMRQLNKVEKALELGRYHSKYVVKVKLVSKIDVEEVLQDNDKFKVLIWKILWKQHCYQPFLEI